MSTIKKIIPDEYDDPIYRLTYHLLGKVARHIPVRIHPNHLTLCAFFFAILGCYLLYVIDTPVAYLYWALCNFTWYLLDALDGIHARLTEQASNYGGFLDHYMDNLFFIVMFSVFTVKFDLVYPVYISIMLMRFTAATSIFIAQAHTGKVYLSRFSGGAELLLLTSVMLLSFFWPSFDLMQCLGIFNPGSFLAALHLNQGVFMKVVLLFYGIGLPVHFFMLHKKVKSIIY